MNRGCFLCTKVQHGALSVSCGEACTSEGHSSVCAGVGAGVVAAGGGSSDGIEKEQKTADVAVLVAEENRTTEQESSRINSVKSGRRRSGFISRSCSAVRTM